ncbi:hypothetical protein [Actinomadura sp.]|uniref:hypothetical protein n=1 Tax=Actinomadura sp. TaxID=1989 RepID=UPI0037C90056
MIIEGDDLQELDELTRSLEEELLLLDSVTEVERPEEESPEGAKSATVAAIGTLIVSGVFSRAALRALVGLVAEWRKRTEARKVELVEGDDSLAVEGLSAKEQRELIDRWLRRREGDG